MKLVLPSMKKTSRVAGSMKAALLLALAALSISVVAGCGATPTTDKSPSPTPQANTVYPVTATDLLGRPVQISKKPVSIVTLLPTATETLYTVGGVAVGRDSSSKYPPEVANLPAVGSAYNPSVESVAALKPDLIIIEALSQERLIAPLEKLGAPVIAVRAATVDDVYSSLVLVGKVIDRNKTAADAVAQIKSRFETIKKSTRTGRSVLILISDANRNIYAAKNASYPGTLAGVLGQVNPAAGIPDSGPYPGFGLLSGEQAISMQPDVILTISPAPAPAPKLSDTLVGVPGYGQLAAVKNGKVKELDPVLFLQAQGPRIADAAEQMAKILNEVAP